MKAVSSGSSRGPQGAKSGAAMVKCVKALWPRKKGAGK